MGLLERSRQPALDHQLRDVQMTALERFSAAYAITGFSVRLSLLAEIDRREEAERDTKPATS